MELILDISDLCEYILHYTNLYEMYVLRFVNKSFFYHVSSYLFKLKRDSPENQFFEEFNGQFYGWDNCKFVRYAAENDFNRLIYWVYDNGCDINYKISMVAAQRNNVELFKWLRDNRCNMHNRLCHIIAKSGHLDILKLVKSSFNHLLKPEILNIAIKYGHLEMVKYLCKVICQRLYSYHRPYSCLPYSCKGNCLSQRSCELAIHFGHLDIVMLYKKILETSLGPYLSASKKWPLIFPKLGCNLR